MHKSVLRQHMTKERKSCEYNEVDFVFAIQCYVCGGDY